MDSTFKLVSVMVSLMQTREKGIYASEAERLTHVGNWVRVLEVAKTHLARPAPEAKEAITKMVEAMEMQDHREAERFHMTADTALSIWNPAREAGEAFLNRATQQTSEASGKSEASAPPAVVNQTPPGVSGAEGHLKQRAESMGNALSKFGVSLKHGQLLTVVARMEGRSCFQAMKSALDRFKPNFCPHCGAAASLENVGSVFCEQGEYDGKSFEAEGDGAQYACTRCNGQFTDWSGLETGDNIKASEPDDEEVIFEAKVFETQTEFLDRTGTSVAKSTDFDFVRATAIVALSKDPYAVRIVDTRTGWNVDF